MEDEGRELVANTNFSEAFRDGREHCPFSRVEWGSMAPFSIIFSLESCDWLTFVGVQLVICERSSGGKYDRKLQRYLVNLGAQGTNSSGGNKMLGLAQEDGSIHGHP